MKPLETRTAPVKQLSKARFEWQYARRSGLTVEELHDLGLQAVPCQCKESFCRGWAMLHGDPPDDAPT